MAEYILWLEGVDFDNTFSDTNDISTIRGSSLTLLRAPSYAYGFLAKKLEAKNVKNIFSGASMGAMQLSGHENVIAAAVDALKNELETVGEAPQEIEKAKRDAHEKKLSQITPVPLAHMKFVLGLAEVINGDYDKAIEMAKANANASRYQAAANKRWPLNQDAGIPPVNCEKALNKAAQTTIYVGADDDGFGSKSIYVSRSVAARREFGRWARQGFYADNLFGGASWFDWDKYSFTDSLYEMVENTRPEHGHLVDGKDRFEPPQALNNKIALFYADGNKFGTILDDIISEKGAIGGRSHFSTKLLKYQNEKFLTEIIQNLYINVDVASKPEIDRVVYYDADERIYKLRLETLLWGGDEVEFAMPAWLGWWFARAFFKTVENWKIDGHDLTFSAGLVFCNYKTPIRSVRALAKAMGDDAKAAHDESKPPANYLNVDVLESTDPPQEGIANLRKRLTGCPDGRLIIPGGEVGDYIDQVARLKGIDNLTLKNQKQNMPRSQVYRIIHQTMKKGSLADNWKDARQLFDDYLKRNSAERGAILKPESLDLTSNCEGEENFALNLYRLAQHWDYIDNFAAPSPDQEPEQSSLEKEQSA